MTTLVTVLPTTAAGQGLAPLPVTDADRAIASLPGLASCINAGFLSGKGLRNMAAQGSYCLPPGTGQVALGTLGGKPAALLSANANRLIAPVRINPAEWTIFFALANTDSGTGLGTNSASILRSESAETTLRIPNIYFTGATRTLRLGSTSATDFGSARITGGDVGTAPAFWALTLSAENGLAVWKNGARVAHNPSDTLPFEAGYEAAEWSWLRASADAGACAIGWAGHCNEDITKARYSADGTAGHMARLWRFMQAEYGIA